MHVLLLILFDPTPSVRANATTIDSVKRAILAVLFDAKPCGRAAAAATTTDSVESLLSQTS